MEFNSWLNIFGFKPLTENDSSEESDHNNNLLIPDIQDVALSNAVAESAGETAELVLEEESVNEGKTAVCLVLPKESDDKLEEKRSVKRVDTSVFGVHGEESVGNVSEDHEESVDKVKAIDFELQEERLEERDDTLGMDVVPRVTFQEIGEVTVSTNKKSFECSICNKTYTLKASLKRHMNVHNTEGGLNCSVCGKTYYILSAFNQHKKMHSTARYRCKVCSKIYVTKLGCKRHESTHEDKYTYYCEVCGKSFSYKSDLVDHTATHYNSRHFKCAKCSQTFKARSCLVRHKTTCGINKHIKCEICGSMFKSNRYLKEHSRKHKAYVELHQCPICGKTFTHHSSLYRHKKKAGHY